MRMSFDTVDDAVYAVAHFTDGKPAKALAGALGLPEGRFYDLTDAQRKPKFPAALVVPLTVASGNDALVQTICRLAGGHFLRVPQAAPAEADVLHALGEVLREVGEDAKAIGTSLADDGRLDAREVPSILDDIDQSIEELARLRAAVARRAGVPSLREIGR